MRADRYYTLMAALPALEPLGAEERPPCSRVRLDKLLGMLEPALPGSGQDSSLLVDVTMARVLRERERELAGRIEPTRAPEQLQASEDRTLGGVLMRLGPTEIHHESVAQILGNVAFVSLDDGAACPLIGLHQPPQVLGVHSLSERRRTDHVKNITVT